MNALAAEIKNAAQRLGFDAVGITDAEPLVEAGQNLQHYIQEGRQGNMDWLERTFHQRFDPKAFFPEAKSVIMVVINYFRQEEMAIFPKESGNISIYARGRDYHRVVRYKLKKLLDWICEKETSAKGRIFVDSFPLMEKPLAVRAGLGWIAKNTNLILKKRGSFFFLGGILLNLSLPPDDPFTGEYCGQCQRCLTICPTRALTAPFQIDARRCLSYLTIEHRGEIAEKFYPSLRNFIFGCDLCQLVCPWNQKYAETCSEKDFQTRFSASQLSLVKLKSLTAEQFKEMFSGTAVSRLGYQRFKRNVHIAWQNIMR